MSELPPPPPKPRSSVGYWVVGCALIALAVGAFVVETVTHNTTAVYVGVFLTLGGIVVLQDRPSRKRGAS
jgi:uncharacterized membrane protein HdeD (DUF308 family)